MLGEEGGEEERSTEDECVEPCTPHKSSDAVEPLPHPPSLPAGAVEALQI